MSLTLASPGAQNNQGKSLEATTLITLDKEQTAAIIRYASMAQVSLTNQWSLRSNMEQIDRAYQRELDWTESNMKSRLANRTGDADKFQNVTVPIVMPQVQAALGYLMNVFLTGYPMFGVTSDPSNENAAMQMEALITENSVTAGWARQLIMFFRDGLKYNLCAAEINWEQRTNWTIQTDATKPNGSGAKKILWQGNTFKRMDLYNTFWDPRVHPCEMHEEGEYAGYTELYSRSRFKKFTNSLYNQVSVQQVKAALASSSIQGAIGANTTAPFGYYQPLINPFPFYQRTTGFDWMAWAAAAPQLQLGQSRTNLYSVTRFYARIIPSDFDLRVPERNTPQVWKFIIVNGTVILSAERMSNVHNFIPILFSQPIEDGLDYQTKSFASNVEPMQAVASAAWNGYIAGKRRLVGDRVLYDPSRVTQKDINNSNPSAKIPVRPSAYGRPIQEAVYQFPYRDEPTEGFVQASSLIINYANSINGQNPAQQGQFVKGNKTLHEYDDVMGHGNSANQMMALSFEYTFFVPAKEILKLNMLQYQPEAIVYNPNTKQNVAVDPVALRKESVHFKVSDGLIPTDKITGDDMLQVAIQQLGTSPQLAAGFNLPDAFAYLMKTQGVDLSPFQKSPAQVQYEQAMQAWTEAAQNAAKMGQTFSTPQPQPSPQLQQEMQQRQATGSGPPGPTASTAESTVGA